MKLLWLKPIGTNRFNMSFQFDRGFNLKTFGEQHRVKGVRLGRQLDPPDMNEPDSLLHVVQLIF